MSKLIETVTVQQEITGIIADLVYFARYIGHSNLELSTATDTQLIALAKDFLDTQHGED